MSLRSAPGIVHPVIHLIRMGDSLVLLPRSSLQSARASKKITSEILFGKLRTPSDSFISKNEGMAKGYITWDQFLANRQRLAANRTNLEVLAGPVREGLCLLQGLLLCGACGRRLGVHYTDNGGLYPIYQCIWKHREGLAPHACLSTPSKPLDDAIAQRLLTAVTPLSI